MSLLKERKVSRLAFLRTWSGHLIYYWNTWFSYIIWKLNTVTHTHTQIHQQIMGCRETIENLWRISKSEKISFQMVTERSYAIWWLNMFRDWVTKSRNSNWKITSTSSVLTLGTESQWKPDEWSTLDLGDRESAANTHKGSPEEKGFVVNGTELINDARLAMEPMKWFQEGQRVRKRRRLCGNLT